MFILVVVQKSKTTREDHKDDAKDCEDDEDDQSCMSKLYQEEDIVIESCNTCTT